MDRYLDDGRMPLRELMRRLISDPIGLWTALRRGPGVLVTLPHGGVLLVRALGRKDAGDLPRPSTIDGVERDLDEADRQYAAMLRAEADRVDPGA
jgi:hypothetical protein